MCKSKVGIVTMTDREGKPIDVLRWESGSRSKEEGRDLASVCRSLTDEQLEEWLEAFHSRALYNESRIIHAEIDRRKGFR